MGTRLTVAAIGHYERIYWKPRKSIWYRINVFGPEDETSLQSTDADGSHIGARALHDSSGVDRSLIRSNLRRTPTECLQALEEMLQLSESARRVERIDSLG